jgi:6-phosphogluconate dehydrogenase
MVPAGRAVDHVIERLTHVLEEGDIIIDGGNSHASDTTRRFHDLEAKGFHFVGAGVSGGEEGALNGPSLMPGGSPTAWERLMPIFMDIAGKAHDQQPCCAWIGREGSGHFVKTIHNGIEYADMQLIAETYYLMKTALGMKSDQLQQVFSDWNRGDLSSYLIEITAQSFGEQDPDTGKPLVEMILDAAGQKGTGKWSSQMALDLGVAAPTIAQAVFARCMSAIKDQRVTASTLLPGADEAFDGDRQGFVDDIRDALFASKICAYAQGFALLEQMSQEHKWDLDLGRIASIWRAGCIIRAQFLDRIREAYAEDAPVNLMLAPYFLEALRSTLPGLRRVVVQVARLGIASPAFSSALAYYDSYRAESLSANLLQAQRDFFGAHTYERIDRPRGSFFHTQWSANVTG